jgi:hypothetical protein
LALCNNHDNDFILLSGHKLFLYTFKERERKIEIIKSIPQLFVSLSSLDLNKSNYDCFPVILVTKAAPAKAAPAPANRSLNAPLKVGSNNASNHQVEELSNQLMDMRLNLEGLEKERDFYFSKLRDIEIL